MTFLAQTWYDPRLVLGPSPVHGQGLFAADAFAAGELVMEWGGTAYRVSDVAAGRVPPGISYAIVDEDVLLAGPVGCQCGTAECRGTVTGSDWQKPALRQRYRGHFLPFIERRIAASY